MKHGRQFVNFKNDHAFQFMFSIVAQLSVNNVGHLT